MAGIDDINDYREEIAILEPMFGGKISAAVIASVLESCNGDINVAAEAIMNFDNETTSSIDAARESREQYDVNSIPVISTDEPAGIEPPILTTLIPQNDQAPSISYSEAFRNTGAVPKRPDTKSSKSHYKSYTKPDPIERILEHHHNGNRILIFMRGAPGSGKSHLAKHIIDKTVGGSAVFADHIFSTDDFFMRNGVYRHDKYYLQTAHSTNHKKVWNATHNGISPIIVDNTNSEHWEMEPYASVGVRNGYIIEIIEPKTPWAKNESELAKKNIHRVPQDTVRRVLERCSTKITPKSLITKYNLVYPDGMKPPVKRLFPPICYPDARPKSPEKTSNEIECDINNSLFGAISSKVEIVHRESPESPDEHLHNIDETNKIAGVSEKLTKIPGDNDILSHTENAHPTLLQKMIEAQKQFEQLEKVEKEWDNGESWDGATKNVSVASQDLAVALEPKPPREADKNNSNQFIGSASICDDWTKISMFMPPWQEDKGLDLAMAVETLKQVETKSVGTCLEAGDRSGNIHKVLYGECRNINEVTSDSTTEIKKSKMPKVMMLDKSTSTHENDLLTQMQQCPYKEHHFRILRRLCKHVPRNILRDVYEDCNCDVDWAYNLVLDGYPPMPPNFVDNEDDSDTEEEPIEGCGCFASFNNLRNMIPLPAIQAPVTENNSPSSSPMSQKKPKKEIKMSDSSLSVKRRIEKNIMISDNHYSQHYLNMRRRRENPYDGASKSATFNAKTEDVADASGVDKVDTDKATALPYTINNNSSEIRDIAIPSTSHYNFEFLDLTDSDTESDKSDDVERTASVNLGFEFIANLDEIFGRESFEYPENIQPIVNLPISLLREINAHWATSVTYQMDYGSNQSVAMIKQDEDFARQLAAKGQELTEEGKEPDVPSLKEIMDMELAYSIYERNIAEWRNNEPQDLAARLSREKLYNLFPDLSKEILSEMLMAHDYCFKTTIEILLVSTGRADDWLQDEKGVEKFVMQKEMERKEKFLEEQNKNLTDVEWPLLTDSELPITLETVNHYRAEAEKSLLNRNANFEKARQYFARNSPFAASFYSDIAALHTKKYEQSSCLAAAYLMNYHLKNNPDKDVLDLHYLRVSEAMVNLDLFLDGIILKLRRKNLRQKEVWVITGKGKNSKGGPRIKPATKRRLKARDIVSKEVNGGLLSATLQSTDRMTNELAQLENS